MELSYFCESQGRSVHTWKTLCTQLVMNHDRGQKEFLVTWIAWKYLQSSEEIIWYPIGHAACHLIAWNAEECLYIKKTISMPRTVNPEWWNYNQSWKWNAVTTESDIWWDQYPRVDHVSQAKKLRRPFCRRMCVKMVYDLNKVQIYAEFMLEETETSLLSIRLAHHWL